MVPPEPSRGFLPLESAFAKGGEEAEEGASGRDEAMQNSVYTTTTTTTTTTITT